MTNEGLTSRVEALYVSGLGAVEISLALQIGKQAADSAIRRLRREGKIESCSARLERLFWASVNKKGSNDCWPWEGLKDKLGYGRTTRTMPDGSTMYGAHSAALFYSTGLRASRATDTVCIHSCDNRLCCNPNHIRVGTHAENMADMASKGRGRNGYMTGTRKSTKRGTGHD